MNPLNPEWAIQSRGDRCEETGHEFVDGEFFYTLLFHDKDGYRRQDMCEAAWKARNENIQPFSFWRTKFVPPAPPAPETVTKETAEDLLRSYMAESDDTHATARYLLAVMLERKRLLKNVASETKDGVRTLVYEHVKTGEVFVLPDPQLRLDQLEAVQLEVAALL
jgi:hypothetical protein